MLDRLRSIALLVGRIGIGVIFFVHGWQKFTTMGLGGVTAFFDSLGIPLAGVAAPAVAVLEVVGGIALILGAGLPVFGSLLVLNMIGAIVFVHGANGFAVDKGGYEFVLALAAATLAIAFSGGGALAVDSLWQRRSAPVPVSAA
ncbi:MULTISPECIES: DoxX family protein [Streptosporangium]|uniref:Oxidoreductase n=1 Tax=Streptosporangium brasiliense TaxID=47480 RepID=A0ABT9RCV0_9ACTN|nr:DoxX family protein [Streptosporangium brasiliense]MDP9866978.1 putative oxidoreductase [Streptosporangium brasiliense]